MRWRQRRRAQTRMRTQRMSLAGLRFPPRVTSSPRLLGLALRVAFFSSIVLGSPTALAEDRVRAVLEFEGARDCADAQLLENEVKKRSEWLSWAQGGHGDIRITVRLDAREEGYEAEVVVSRPPEADVRRVLAGGTCEEVIEGVSLVIAVSVPAPPPSEAPPPAAAFPVIPEDRRALPPEANAPFRLGLGAGPSLLEGLAPGVMPGLEAFGELAVDGNGWAPAFRVGFRHAGRSGFDAGSGKAAFRLDAAIAELCPVGVQAPALVRLRPCVVAVGGVLEASGSGLARNTAENHPWFALGVAARAEIRLVEELSLELAGSAEFSLTPGQFWVDDVPFHETSPLTLRAGLAVVTRLW